jgi:riboflavin biosynthesis pyrimidine reductase
MNAKQINQVTEQLSKISVFVTNMELVRADRSTLDIKAVRFGKHQERFTVALDSRGNVRKGSVRFYGARDAELN